MRLVIPDGKLLTTRELEHTARARATELDRVLAARNFDRRRCLSDYAAIEEDPMARRCIRGAQDGGAGVGDEA